MRVRSSAKYHASISRSGEYFIRTTRACRRAKRCGRETRLINGDTLHTISRDYTDLHRETSNICPWRVYRQGRALRKPATLCMRRRYEGGGNCACSSPDYVNGLRTRPQFDSREPGANICGPGCLTGSRDSECTRCLAVRRLRSRRQSRA